MKGQLTDSAVQTAVKTEFFPNQLTVMPRHGDKVAVGGSELAWHAVDTIGYNVNLYHFAYALGKPTSNVLFWAVTVVNSPREMPGRSPRNRIQCGLCVVGQRQGSDRHLQRPADGDRRWRVQAAHASEGSQRRPRGHRQRWRRHGLLCAVSRRRVPAGQGHHGDVWRIGSDQQRRAYECESETFRNVPGRRGWLVRSGSEGSRPPFASARAAGPRRCAAARGDRHKDSRLLSAELQRERPAGVPAEQHGRARRHRRGHHGDRAGRIAGHGAQRRPKRHRQERVRHRDDLASGLHGRVLLARARNGCTRSARSTSRCGTSRARR